MKSVFCSTTFCVGTPLLAQTFVRALPDKAIRNYLRAKRVL